MSTPIPNLSQHQPRVAMTDSMLKAYAAMRGIHDRNAGKNMGPLHDTLFESPDRETCCKHIRFGSVSSTRIEVLFSSDNKLSLWWDPLATSQYQPEYGGQCEIESESKLRTPDLIYDTGKENNCCERSSTNYRSSSSFTLPGGVEVLSNFGYLNINNEWHDFDRGFIDCTAPDPATINFNTATQIRRTAENVIQSLGWIKQSLPLDAEQYIMSDEEYAKLDSEYQDDIKREYEIYSTHTDERQHDVGFDIEGALHGARITPAQFAMLAVGTSECEKFVAMTCEEVDVVDRLPNPPGSRVSVVPHLPPPQYDEDDGQRMSGIWSEDSNPSVQESPRGVNFDKLPKQVSWMLPNCYHDYQVKEYEARHNLVPLSPVVQPDNKPAGRHVIYTDDDIYNELGEEAYYSNRNNLNDLHHRYNSVNARNTYHTEVKQRVFARREYLRVIMSQIHKVVKQDMLIESKVDRSFSAQGRGQSVPDTQGVYGGKSLRRSVGRIEDLEHSMPSPRTSKNKNLRCTVSPIAAYLESEKRRLAACIEREEEVKQRLNDEIYQGTSENAELEKKRQSMFEILQGNFRFVEEEETRR